MLDVIIKVRVAQSAEKEIIGLKEALANEIERWGTTDIEGIDVRQVYDLENDIIGLMSTKDFVDEFKRRNLTIEELRNVSSAVIELGKIK